ncbi:MAG: OmpH family outer membrane protein [Bacteroidetes bacterium]|nr:OmpH family outer membrane protein [Bacteroidota bacterium]
MKNVSLIISAVLAAAVAILFYMNASLKKELQALAIGGADADAPKVVLQPAAPINSAELKNARIAYINIDSLDFRYQYIIDNSKEYANKQAAIESQLNSMAAKFQNDYTDFQQAVQAGVRGEAELAKQKAQLEQQQYDAAAKQKQLEGLGEEIAKKRGEMLKKVSDYIASYNNGRYDYILAYTTANISSVLYAKPDLDITKEIIDGLNAEYKAHKTSTKK